MPKYKGSRVVSFYNAYYAEPVRPILRAKIVKVLVCPRCGYEWVPKIEKPKFCPNCVSRLEYPPEVDPSDPVNEMKAEFEELKGLLERAAKVWGISLEELKENIERVIEEEEEKQRRQEELRKRYGLVSQV